MFDKTQAVVYEDEDGHYINAVELHSLVRTGDLSFVSQHEERNVMVDKNGTERVLHKVGNSAEEVDGYDPKSDRYVENVDWL